ncbi:hypothetical protein EVAR_22070_1 [Eumeta japonica]|uniref:Uncharacterized protein n=1 Tax=Eumeta variegata TaxID=151549 RepID=A0A4C1USN4_EUMVA|nr:hypothetical protein EVAR_22070_1 [Eumeta japonica]
MPENLITHSKLARIQICTSARLAPAAVGTVSARAHLVGERARPYHSITCHDKSSIYFNKPGRPGRRRYTSGRRGAGRARGRGNELEACEERKGITIFHELTMAMFKVRPGRPPDHCRVAPDRRTVRRLILDGLWTKVTCIYRVAALGHNLLHSPVSNWQHLDLKPYMLVQESHEIFKPFEDFPYFDGVMSENAQTRPSDCRSPGGREGPPCSGCREQRPPNDRCLQRIARCDYSPSLCLILVALVGLHFTPVGI